MGTDRLGHGGVLTIACKDAEAARILATKLQDEKLGLYAVSLGFSRTGAAVSSDLYFWHLLIEGLDLK